MERLVGTVQPYPWGSLTALPELLGIEPDGSPQAELWLGAHPLAPSRIQGQTLDAAISAGPATMIGAGSLGRFGPRLPYLLKVLAAGQPLSLQAHPSRAQAEAGYAREESAGIPRDAAERTYRDDWPKPEAICALGEFHALCGFRDPAVVRELFDHLQVPAVDGLLKPLGDGRVAEVFGTLLRLPAEQHEVIDQVVDAARQHTADSGRLGDFARTAVELAQCYPGDRGVLAALLMNRITLHKNQALFLPAGNLHAYLRGTGVEIMANSDNVLRGGLTSKHVDVDELLRLLDFTPGEPPLVEAVEEEPAVWGYRTPAPEFSLWRLEPSDQVLRLPGDGSGRVALVTDGALTLDHHQEGLMLERGQSAFISAVESQVSVTGTGTLFVAAPGVR